MRDSVHDWYKIMKIEDTFLMPSGYYIRVRCTCGNGFNHKCSADIVHCPHCGKNTTVTELMRSWETAVIDKLGNEIHIFKGEVSVGYVEPHKVSSEMGWYCRKCNRAWSQEIKKCPICLGDPPEVSDEATWNCNQCNRVWSQEVKKCPVCNRKSRTRKTRRRAITWT